MSKKLTVVQVFSRLSDEKKIKFTEKNLEALRKMMANPKTKTAFFQKFLTILFMPQQQTNINPKDLKMLQQILVSFLFSLKPEFLYEWAQTIDLTVGYPLPKDFKQRKQQVKSKKWFHIGLPPDLWRKVSDKMNELGSVDSFFAQAIEALSKESRKRKRKKD